MKYSYNICDSPDYEIFKKQCLALEAHIPNITTVKRLTDVDGSETQIYEKDGKRIAVKNSFYVGALFIESDIQLEQFFNN